MKCAPNHALQAIHSQVRSFGSCYLEVASLFQTSVIGRVA